MKTGLSMLAFIFLTAIALIAARALGQTRERGALDVVVDVQQTSLRKACVAGASMLALAEYKLERGDEEMARDVLAYGLPWIDLCSHRRADPLPEADLRAEIRALRIDLDRWRDAP